ncbi:flavin reductase family protein [Nitrospirillum sp. BR 11163]|uniref:flavin reductase family protein n=1 Tax=Nitrospirillum sp. BR 11163 TaxID=3104323 RepID=UPI002AFE542F|nr:flavin reductase family protein [Nitrospirillum sp. BR 11163]MEA1672771.1 flavin reductase family protein [Nitrospirillum sp. BR 11163]
MPTDVTAADAATIALALRKGLRSLAKAVVVITCRHGGQRHAMTATAVSELSMDPPSMLICVNKSASLFAPLSQGADFCINILTARQAEISALCAGKEKGEARFSVGDWRQSPLGHAYLADAQASIFCRSVANTMFGTHGLFIGEVQEVIDLAPIDPLVYMDGRYGCFVAGLGAAERR